MGESLNVTHLKRGEEVRCRSHLEQGRDAIACHNMRHSSRAESIIDCGFYSVTRIKCNISAGIKFVSPISA